jgi:hypothetical protein
MEANGRYLLFGCSQGEDDKAKTQIPFGNDKKKG